MAIRLNIIFIIGSLLFTKLKSEIMVVNDKAPKVHRLMAKHGDESTKRVERLVTLKKSMAFLQESASNIDKSVSYLMMIT